MAKSQLNLEARKMRAKGISVRTIAQQLHVSRSTASLWVRDIILSIEQLETLRKCSLKGSERGRLLGAMKQKQDRLKRIDDGIQKGKNAFPIISKRELFIAGIALYWAEGTKKKRELTFCNSDPKLVQFMLTWLYQCFDIPIQRLRCYVGINEIHRSREEDVKTYWSDVTHIPLNQFSKTSFKKVQNKKVYENFYQHFGTFTVKVKQPAQLYYEVLGLIDGLSTAKTPA